MIKNLWFLFLTACVLTPFTSYSFTTVEFRAAAFFPMSQDVRDIYDDVGVDYQVEVATSLPCFSCLQLWVNFDWITQHGHPKGHCHGHTDLHIENISLGLKSQCQLCGRLYGYVGIGPTFGRVKIRNSQICCRNCHNNTSHTSKLAIGGIVKVGVNYYFNRCIFLDLFVDYLFQPVHFHRFVNVGGFRAGAGIGFGF